MPNIHGLSLAAVKKAKPGKRADGTPRAKVYSDGGGLYLQVTPGELRVSRSWIFRYASSRRERYMELGWFDTVSLAEARANASECRKRLEQGKVPIASRDTLRAAFEVEASKALTFDECAQSYVAAHRASWRNVKHAAQWERTLAVYASPVFGKLPVRAVELGHVIKVLEPIWTKKPETASRVRGRIEAVLDWAATRGFREAENPARWKGRLEKLLPRRSKVRAVRHHPALPLRISVPLCRSYDNEQA